MVGAEHLPAGDEDVVGDRDDRLLVAAAATELPVTLPRWARLGSGGGADGFGQRQDRGVDPAHRLLRLARNTAVESRAAAICQVRYPIITTPQALRDQLSDRKALRGKAAVCARFRLSGHNLARPSRAVKFAPRSLARRIETPPPSSRNSMPQLRRPPTSFSGSAPAIPDNCSSPPVRTSIAPKDQAAFAAPYGADPCLLGQDHSPPRQPRRRPSGQPCTAPHCCLRLRDCPSAPVPTPNVGA